MRAKIFQLFILCALLSAAATSLPAATYYVSLNGSDAMPGSLTQPWRTIQKAAKTLKAGDTAVVGPGDYDEYVTQTTSGSDGNRITYRASMPHATTLRGFRVNAKYVTLDGLKITKTSSVGVLWCAAIYIDPNSHNLTITNCWISDSPLVITNDFYFNSSDSEIRSMSSDFTTAGFKPGSKVYLGACDLTPLWFTNHDSAWVVSSNTATSLWVTNAAGGSFTNDIGSDYWAMIAVGAPGSPGIGAVHFQSSGGVIPTNCVVVGNVISNWFGRAIEFQGNGCLIASNTITKLYGFHAIQTYAGSDNVFRGNIIRHSPNVMNWAGTEVASIVEPGVDYQYAQLSILAQSSPVRTNILWESNWVEDLDNQMGRVDDEDPNTWGITFRNNVFIGIAAQFSGGRDYMSWISNTFYRCSYDNNLSPLALGGRAPTHTNYVITGNLFIECGQTNRLDTGWYSITTNAIISEANSNMVSGFEISGYPAKDNFQLTCGFNNYTTETNGINGGDPGFVNALDPDGPDNIPFTDDDGLKVLPNSPAARIGGGALGVLALKTNQPIAHFRITSPNGWFAPMGSNYNPGWWTNTPYGRGGSLRPWNTPQTIGTAPVSATFSADLSISGVDGSLTNTAISNYLWEFGDGTTTATNRPVVSHLFSRPGDRIVALTVENTAGWKHTVRNIYRIANTTELEGQPRPPTGLMVIGIMTP